MRISELIRVVRDFMKYNLMALLVCLFTLICGTAFAYTPPAPTGYVTDMTGSLTSTQVAQLNSKIFDFNRRTQNEIAVLLIKSVGDSNIEDLTHETFKAWRVGKSGLDNGVLLVLAVESRKMRLQTGKGVEGDITDLQASDILGSMKPSLKNKDYYEALNLATGKIMALLESRHGQKVDPGQGAQFNKPLPSPETTTVPVTQTPHAATCAVGATGFNTDLTWFAGFILLFVVGIVFARFMIRRNARLAMEELERKVEAELEAERKEAARLAEACAQLEKEKLEKERLRIEEEKRQVTQTAPRPVIPSPVPRPTPGSQAKETARRAAQSVKDTQKAAKTVAKTVPSPVPASEVSNAAAIAAAEAARAKREAEDLRREEAAREAQRQAAAKQRAQEDEDRRRRQREEDDRASSYSSSSSWSSSSSDSSSSWGSSDSGSGFGGGDSGGGGSSSDW